MERRPTLDVEVVQADVLLEQSAAENRCRSWRCNHGCMSAVDGEIFEESCGMCNAS